MTKKYTCDGAAEHRGRGTVVIDRGDSNIIFCLGNEAGQHQGGNVAINFDLPKAKCNY